MLIRFLALAIWGAVLLAIPVYAGSKIDLVQSDGSITTLGGVGSAVNTTLKTTLSCEDVLNGICVVEERYLTIPSGGSTAKISSDQAYKVGAGFVRSISCYSDATATAGTIAVRDSTIGGAGLILFEFDVLAVAYNPIGIKEDLNALFSTGLYLDFTTTADMQCTLRYR